MGINKIFSFDADLRNIAEGSKDLVVSNVIQKAQIEIDEKGTVAAAVAGSYSSILFTIQKFYNSHKIIYFKVSLKRIFIKKWCSFQDSNYTI